MKLLTLFIFLFSANAFADESCTKDFLKKNGFNADLKLVVQGVVEHTMMMSQIQYDGYFAVDGNCKIIYIPNDKKSSKVVSGKIGNCQWMEAAKIMMSIREGNPPKGPALGKTVCNSLPK